MKNFTFIILLFASCASVVPNIPEENQLELKATPIVDMQPIDIIQTGIWIDPQGVGHQGGLYPDGFNVPPTGHANKIAKATNQISGVVGVMTIGASNCFYESEQFDSLMIGNSDAILVNAALGGKTLEKMQENSYWVHAHEQVTSEGLTDNDIQVVIFESNSFDAFINVATFMQWQGYIADMMTVICQRVLTEFPKTRVIYLPGTTYSGYYQPGYNKFAEPWSYYLSWGVKELIERQITGDPSLKCSGPGKISPVLCWMNPNWSDGAAENSFGLGWMIEDVIPSYPGSINNGVHPSVIGASKIASYWFNFFNNDTYAASWF